MYNLVICVSDLGLLDWWMGKLQMFICSREYASTCAELALSGLWTGGLVSWMKMKTLVILQMRGLDLADGEAYNFRDDKDSSTVLGG